MFAIQAAIDQNIKDFRNKSILAQSDNKTVVAHINKEGGGGTKSLAFLHHSEDLLAKVYIRVL